MSIPDEVFEAVVEGISSDGFLTFIDRFLSTDNGLCWPPEAGTSYSLQHLQFHAQYTNIYESRVRSVLRKHGVSEDDFAAQCRLAQKQDRIESPEVSRRDLVDAVLEMLTFADSGNANICGFLKCSHMRILEMFTYADS